MGKIISDESRELFPISNINNLLTFVENEFINPKTENKAGSKAEPNLALLSIVLGRIEHLLVFASRAANNSSASIKKPRSNKVIKKLVRSTQVSNGEEEEPLTETASPGEYSNGGVTLHFPPLEYDVVLALYEKFKAVVFASVNPELITRDRNSPEGTSRELIKSISDVFWDSLSRNYLSDKPHLQTLYTYLMDYKLDSFGLALAVVAACQILGFQDVHLVLSEGHAWVQFGESNNTAEVTWHGKETEDKRGRVIEDNPSWLYLKGSPVVCNRWMEMAAVVAAINSSINALSESLEIGLIKQKLLGKLHGLGFLQRYPMAIVSLAHLEEKSSPTVESSKVCTDLYEEAISSSKSFYNNMHVQPYIFYGRYLYRHEDFKGALKYWSEAAQAVGNYRYSKVDEEIYKEFFEISKDLLTSMMKRCSAGFSAKSPTRDPACYADLLRFFDGICLWEELGKTPVLHITWAQCWINSITKFESTAREGVRLYDEDNIKVPKRSDDEPMICDTPSPNGNEPSTSGFMDMNGNSKGTGGDVAGPVDEDGNRLISVYLRSFKMKGVKGLLQKDKFNAGNFTLQLTAQPTLLATAGSHNRYGGRTRGVKTKATEDASSPNVDSTASKKRKRMGWHRSTN